MKSDLKKTPIYQRVETSRGDERNLSIDEAYTLFKTKSAIFMDGRTESSFKSAHIKTAISVYYKTAEINPILKEIDKGQLIVTYCNNAKCPIAHFLSNKLRHMGFTNVYVFTGGMKEWKSANYPMESEASLPEL